VFAPKQKGITFEIFPISGNVQLVQLYQ
jgi:hypothetical protein